MNANEIRDKLAAPFAAAEIQWRAIAVKGHSALAAPYVDARAVMRRLDEVLGVDGWQDSYAPLVNGCVVCTLRVHVEQGWIERADVGSPFHRRGRSLFRRLWSAFDADGDEDGNVTKSAYSDALKRAAVKFGVARYLDRVLKVWVEYDPVKRKLLEVPSVAVETGAV